MTKSMVLTESTPIPPEYPSYLEELKKVLLENTDATLASFCRERSINYGKFNRWLTFTAGGFKKLRNEARVAQGIPMDLNERYLRYLDMFKSELRDKINLRFVVFCDKHRINIRSMHAWLIRNKLNVNTIRAQICKEKGIAPPKKGRRPYIPDPLDGDKARAMYGKTLDSYRKVLETRFNYSLRRHCDMAGTDYYGITRWMRFMGITVRQLQKAARLNAKYPDNPQMVMVQFRPNGGTRSDMFKGVSITWPDGKSLHVEECSVIELCTFLYTYDRDQRRNKESREHV